MEIRIGTWTTILEREYRKVYTAEYRLKNPDFWKKTDKTKRKISRNRWKSNHKELYAVYEANRRALKKAAVGNFTKGEWEALKKYWKYMCLCCKKEEPEIKLTIDHIVPLTKGGTNYISNIQPLCISCNSIKHNKYINYARRQT